MAAVIDERQQWLRNGIPIDNAKLYFGEVGQDPKLVPVDVFSDREFQIPLLQPVRTDSQGFSVEKVWLDSRYSIQVDDSLDVFVFQEPDNGEAITSLSLNTFEITDADSPFTVTTSMSGNLITIDATAGDVLVNLPAAAIAGEQFKITFKRVDASANAITIDGFGAETIEDLTTLDLATQNQAETLHCTGTSVGRSWQIEANNFISANVISTSTLATFEITDADSPFALTAAHKGNLIRIDAETADVTVDLLSAATAGDQFDVSFKRVNGFANTITINAFGLNLIEGVGSITIDAQDETITLRCNGVGWFVLSNNFIVNSPSILIDNTDSPFTVPVTARGTLFTVNANSGSVIVNLPSLATVDDQFEVSFRRFDATLSNTITIVADGGDLIATGLSSIALSDDDEAITLHTPIGTGGSWLRTSFFAETASKAEAEAATGVGLRIWSPLRINQAGGSGKLWLKAAGSGTTINGSLNVSSISDTGTGQITVTIDTDMADANYAISANQRDAGALANIVTIITQGSGSFTAECKTRSAGALVNPDSWYFIVLGDISG